MGDAQSAQREDKKDAVAEEESGKVDEAQIEQISEEKPLKSNGQITEVNGKANHSKIEANGHCDEGITAEAILPPKEDISEMEEPLKDDKTSAENVEIHEKESSKEVDTNEEVPSETAEMDAKQNDINKGFKKFFSNIGLKLTVKKGSSDVASDETNKEETQDDQAEDNAKETNKENSDATTCPTPTDVTSDEILENAEEKETESKEDMKSDGAVASSPEEQDANQDATAEDSSSPSGPEEEVVSPIKRFFTTGIFSGLKKKKKTTDEETTEKELEEVGEKEGTETTEQTEEDQQQDKQEVSPSVESTVAVAEHDHNEGKEESQPGESEEGQKKEEASTITTEPEILNSQEKDKVQASPLKRLLSGSSLKKLSKKQRSTKSSDSGEHGSEQLLSSTESADNQKEEGPTQAAADGAEDEDGAWTSFKKLVTPKKRMKKSTLSNEEAQGSVEEPKPSEGEPISDHSTEEGKKRKDSISWEAVLCGSGRRRSRKTSDSDDEAPQIESSHKRQDAAESPLESSNEHEVPVSSPKQGGSSSEGDGESTWKSFKRFVTPKRKAKEEDESKENIQSDSEAAQEESTFSVKKLLSGQIMRKSAEKQGPVSSDEANKVAASDDEDSETPAVVPLSEFDEEETKICIQIHVDQESHTPKEENHERQQNILDQVPEPVLVCESTMDAEEEEVKHIDEALEKQEASAEPAAQEEPDDFTESVDKHQQLSDIPEEGVITETLATEVGEEVARDDTIAEDLIEITSEAITAPEPTADITMTDETEMVSAVSQLSSESSKTSGNTTPVPLEYDVKETATVLNQVVETFSTSPKTVPVCLDEVNAEKVTDSVLPQVLETLVKEEQEESAENKDANVEELDLSEVPTEDFDTVETAVSEIDEVNTPHQEESLEELTEDIHQLVECQTDSVSVADELPEEQEAVADVDSPVEAHQETERHEIVSQGADSADEPKDVVIAQEVQTVTEKEEQVILNVTDQALAEDKVQAVTLDSDGSGDDLIEKEVTSEDISAPERDASEQKEEIVPLTEVSTELEKVNEVNEVEADAAKAGHVPEESKAVPTSTVDSEELWAKSPEVEVKAVDLPPAAENTDEMKETVQHLTEASVESEDKELPVNATTTELVEEPSVLETVHASRPESEEIRVESPEEEVKSEDLPPTKTSTDEPEQTEEHRSTEASVEPELKEEVMHVAITEHAPEPVVLETAQAPESLETDQASKSDSEDISAKSPEEEMKSEILPSAEKDTDEHEQTEEHLKETSTDPEHKEQLAIVVSTEHVQEPEVLETAPAPASDLVENSVKFSEEEVKSEDLPPTKTSTDEPEQTEKHPSTEASVEAEQKEQPVDADITEHIQEPEVSEAVQVTTSDAEDSRAISPEVEVISEVLPSAEKVTEEPEQPQDLLKETSVEPVNVASAEHGQELEVLETIQASASNLVENSVKSPEEEVKLDDVPQQVEEHPADSGIESEDTEQPATAESTEHVAEPEMVKTCQAPAPDQDESSVKTQEKEVSPEDLPPMETSTDQPEPTEEHYTSEVSVEPEVKERAIDVSTTEHVQEPEVLVTSQTSTSDPENSSAKSPEEEVKPEVLPPAEKTPEEPEQEEEHLKETSTEADVNEQPLNVASTEHNEEPKSSDTAPVSDLGENSIKSPEEEVKSEDLPPTKTSADELEQTKELPADASEEQKKQSANAATNEHALEQEQTDANAAPKINSEDSSAESLEKQQIEDAPEVETVTNEPKETTVPINEVSHESTDTSRTEPVQEPEAKDVRTDSSNDLSSEIKAPSEDVLAVETAADEVKHEADEKVEAEENPPVETAKSEEPESLSSNTTDAVNETGEEKEALMNVQVITEITKESITHEQPATDSVPVVDKAENETVCQALEIPESHPQGVQVEQQDRLPEVVEELPIVTAVKVPVVNEETTHVQTLETSVATSAPCEDSAAVTDEPKHEQHLSIVQINVEQEKESELPGTETKAAAVECAALPQEVDCNIKDVPVVMPDVLIENSSEVTEPLIETVANEVVFKEDLEAADVLAETVEEVSVALMMHAPSMLFEENDGIQVQVVDIDINSDEVTVDAVLEVGITEGQEVKYVCEEADEEVDNILATPEMEVEVINRENKLSTDDMTQNVQERSSKAAYEAPAAILEEEVMQQIKESELLESDSNDKLAQKPVDDSTGTFKERHEEKAVVTGDESAAAPALKDLTEKTEISGRFDIAIPENKDNSEETKAEYKKSEVHVAAEEVKSEDLEVKAIHEQVHFSHITQTPTVIPSNTDMAVPQNTGVMASTGNMEPPSSLCLEFKLNIQFGQGRIPGSPPLRRGRMTPVNLTDTSEVQAHAEVKSTNSPQRAASPMPSELTGQARGGKEPAAKVDSVARDMIVTQPAVQEAGIHLMETVHLLEEVKATERATSCVQAAETTQAIRPTGTRGVVSEPKGEVLVKQIEEKDQDVWMDAEEGTDTPKETMASQPEVEKPIEQEEKAAVANEVAMVPESMTKEEDSQQEKQEEVEIIENGSEDEDFTVALEQPVSDTLSLTPVE